ncbi:DUF4232 domain-containing protein [Microtetraspora malaysiensis]|uniref:DUF4232 domain-containing protein n=1 Tax=Microtetraspora malaysiensis TaxID=161358 RepID=UPI003D93D880
MLAHAFRTIAASGVALAVLSLNAGAASAQEQGGRAACTAAHTKVTARTVSRPINHLMITVKNVGGAACDLYGYPGLRFSGAQALAPAVEDSQPQSVVTLRPGKSGYASVILSAADGSGSRGRTVKRLKVYFLNRHLTGGVGGPATPALPARGVYVDGSLKVTYWQSTLQDALTW